MQEKVSIFWFRRDLRLHDNAGLYHALKSGNKVLPIFIFDKNILSDLKDKKDQRITFLHQQIENLQAELIKLNSSIKVFFSTPTEVFEELIKNHKLVEVYTNHDYEPYALKRDSEIQSLLSKNKIEFKTYKDQVIFEKNEVVKDDGSWYSVFSPYARKWKQKLNSYYLKPYPTEKYFENFVKTEPFLLPSLADLGFEKSNKEIPPIQLVTQIVDDYHNTRDIPSKRGTTRISVHLRFGTVSIRHLASEGLKRNETWLNELIWRDFYMMILHHNQHVVNEAFKPKYDQIPWRRDKAQFEIWCQGKTGYPIVDAGMRELNTTGFMHNRVRMIVASFLTKHLLIDWRWGEAYFAEKLIDFELSSNNGGWQWAASSGCDAAPYFRVFNPELQTKKFDPDLKYIKKWVPEFQELSYQQKQVVEHKFARERVLKTFKEALGN